jgi:hypothetical protein
MTKSVSEVIKEAKAVAITAVEGCPAKTYADMTSLLEDVISLAPLMNQDFLGTINEILKEVFEAQKIDDLAKIYDFLNFELVYVLENFKK